MHAALSSCVTSLWMVAVASRKSDSHLSSEWSVARAVESDRAVESGLVVESSLAVALQQPNAGAGEPSLERKLVARRWPARSERIPRMLWLRSTTLGDETKHNNQIWPWRFPTTKFGAGGGEKVGMLYGKATDCNTHASLPCDEQSSAW